MALLPIVSRDGGVPSLDEIRTTILSKFPAIGGGRNTAQVLATAYEWYRPLLYRDVDEDKARQAVVRRRPVLATFGFSKPGWEKFCGHFHDDSPRRHSVLTIDEMKPHYKHEGGGGHAVVLVGCSPNSLTSLNSWGSTWGSNGSFTIQSLDVLGHRDRAMRFYDVYWLESDLTTAEQHAYGARVDEELRRHVDGYPSILNLEYCCPRCQQNAPLAQFRGSVRRAICPNCEERFEPEPGRLVEALYVRAGLNDVT
ncbi:hypothetical protein NW768_011725 [Fusarium equiseti]|uniref:Peptidase C1A papain C-terminal domain-containing protein n=1 Tax=Fusarium equiseti TaxID=61235 RepID=A0ABQ8QW94_FUSEQ|nr:hypothetical protein NW768_011725 [Fusarium equiseti]